MQTFKDFIVLVLLQKVRKRHLGFFKLKYTYLPILVFLGVFSCNRPEIVLESSPKNQDISIEQAKGWFSSLSIKNGRVNANFVKSPDWNQAMQIDYEGGKAVLTPFIIGNADIPRIGKINSKPKDKLTKNDDPLGVDALSNLLIYRKGDQNIAEVITMIPDEDYYKPRKKDQARNKFTGLIIVKNLEDVFLKGFSFVNGRAIGNVLIGKPSESPNGKVKAYELCETVTWYTTACGGGQCYTSYDRTDYVYSWVDSQTAPPSANFYYLTSGGGSVGSNGNGSFTSPGALSMPGIGNTPINKDKINCLKNYSNGSNSSAYKYSVTLYVDQPQANSSAPWSLNGGVGHAFIGLTVSDAGTNNVVQRRVYGYYPENIDKSYVSLWSPVESEIRNNQGDPYDVSYTVQVTASQFTTIVDNSMGWDSNPYQVDAYNCTNAACTIINSVGGGVSFAKTKILISATDPSTGVSEPINIFIYSPGSLGQTLRQMKAANSNLNIVTGDSMSAPNDYGLCN